MALPLFLAGSHFSPMLATNTENDRPIYITEKTAFPNPLLCNTNLNGQYNSEISSSFKHHTIYVNAGYAFITSEFRIPPSTQGHPKNGPDWQLGYDWISRKGFGAGVMYSGYRSSYSFEQRYATIKVWLNYIAPQFVIKHAAGSWLFEGKAGLGYFNYREIENHRGISVGGVGYNASLGAEYALSEYVGIGASLGYIGSSFQKNEFMKVQKDEHLGIFRFYLDLGLRFHF